MNALPCARRHSYAFREDDAVTTGTLNHAVVMPTFSKPNHSRTLVVDERSGRGFGQFSTKTHLNNAPSFMLKWCCAVECHFMIFQGMVEDELKPLN